MAEAQVRTIATGTDGGISFAAVGAGNVPQGKFSYWTLGVFQVLNDITGFDSGGFKEYIGGIKGASWGATASNKVNVAASSPLGAASAGVVTAADILPKGGCTATFTVATASLFTGLTACSVVWGVLIQSHTLGQDVNGASVSSLSGVCTGTPTIAWDES